MDLAQLLLGLLILLTAAAICVVLFDRLGLGSVIGLIVAGVILGPNSPGPILTSNVAALQNVAQLGVVLFLFTIGLDMQPKQFWAMRRQLVGLGGGQVLLTAVVLGTLIAVTERTHWQTAVVLGLGVAMSSTAIVMAILAARGELSTEHGRNSFAILMTQDLSVVPIMALIPLLGRGMQIAPSQTLWQNALLMVAVLGGISLLGRYALPQALGWAGRHRSEDAFGILLFLGIVAAAWAVDLVGISMTLGAFLLGMLVAASDYRYQIAATIAPFKNTLMGLFFISVGMAIDVKALATDWPSVLLLAVEVLVVKIILVTLLSRRFGCSWPTSVRTGFTLSQVGEFSFVLFTASAAAGLLTARGLTLGYLVISLTMIATPLLIKLGDRIAKHIEKGQTLQEHLPAAEMSNHLVIVGLDEIGFLVALMAQKSGVSFVAFDTDYPAVTRAREAGMNAHVGGILASVVQTAAALSRARAAFVSTTDAGKLRAIALTLRQDYPNLDIYARVRTVGEAQYLRSKGIKHAGTTFLESTLFRGESLLKDMGVPETQVKAVIDSLRQDNYKLIVEAYGHAQADAGKAQG